MQQYHYLFKTNYDIHNTYYIYIMYAIYTYILYEIYIELCKITRILKKNI